MTGDPDLDNQVLATKEAYAEYRYAPNRHQLVSVLVRMSVLICRGLISMIILQFLIFPLSGSRKPESSSTVLLSSIPKKPDNSWRGSFR